MGRTKASARVTRGKSTPGRLDALDRWLLATGLPAGEGPVVDLGLGAVPWTTVALAERLDPVQVIGVDSDPERVRCARPYIRHNLSFVEGGFSPALPLARLLRAMNLLRQYPVAEVPAALATMCAQLEPDGWLLEGTCSKKGEVFTARWLPREGPGLLLFGVSEMTRGFAPQRLWPYLPRGLGDHLRPGPELAHLAAAWEAAFAEARLQTRDPAELFALSVQRVGAPLRLGPVSGTAELSGLVR